MSDETPRDVLTRLRAVEWYEWDKSYAHRRSRGMLMREHMRRAALWAEAYGAPEYWPFFDVAQFAEPDLVLDDEVESELDEFVKTVTPSSIRVLCRAAVRWASVQAKELPDLPHPYEPILIMFERGGGYNIEEMIDLYGVSVPYGDFPRSLKLEPFMSLDRFVLDTFDSTAGDRVSYFAEMAGPRARVLVRRRTREVQGVEQILDEVLDEHGEWQPTEQLRDGDSSGLAEITTRSAGSAMSDIVRR
ncbi:hypothetical protein [Streptomyces uncialis]|uniref:hypothetical protein n=1 Tax=Streptomyces uncialis TaxID=1048205 RepID=UPI0038670F10|nr:hypothetical protein OG924_18050 [Streptomyces uncialis]